MSTIQIGPFRVPNVEKKKIKVKVKLNLHGIVSIDSASVSWSIHQLIGVSFRIFDSECQILRKHCTSLCSL